MSTDVYDVAVVGAGPGGYVAAIRAAQRGLRVCAIEKDSPGGVCLNWGCIPSKNLIHQAKAYLGLGEMEQLGVRVDRRGFDYAAVQAGSRAAAKTLSEGVRGLLRRNKVDLYRATATLASASRLSLSGGEHDGAALEARHIILATGSRPAVVPGFEMDERDVLSSTGTLALTCLPGSVAILGAGAIGCEFAYVLNAFGVKVTLVEMAGHILPSEDGDVAEVLQKSLRKAGIDLHTSTRALGWRRQGDDLLLQIESDGRRTELGAEKIIAAFGRRPNTEGLGLETLGVRLDARGHVTTDEFGRSSVPAIYAIGDIVATPALAHAASREAEVAVDHIAGIAGCRPRPSADRIPFAVYCEPQVASFGLREDAARRDGVAYKKSVFPYRGNGKAVATGAGEGFAKLLSDPDSGEILGGHVVGAGATELIHELLLARSAELLAADVAHTVHAHPTLAEIVMEAAMGVDDKPIHI